MMVIRQNFCWYNTTLTYKFHCLTVGVIQRYINSIVVNPLTITFNCLDMAGNVYFTYTMKQ